MKPEEMIRNSDCTFGNIYDTADFEDCVVC